MNDDFEEEASLLDDDPALDYILYEEMEEEGRKPAGKGGCLGITLIIVLLLCYGILHFTVICPITGGG